MAVGEPIASWTKDPNGILPYTVDWSEWLGTDTLATSAWTVPSDITQVTASLTTTTATIVLSGGTSGTSYQFVNRITTAAGLTDDRTIQINVLER